MNYIHDQSQGICPAYAIANAYEKLTGRVMSERAILKLFKAAGGDDPDVRGGAVDYGDILKAAKLAGLISDYKRVYFNPAILMKKSPAKASLLAKGKEDVKKADKTKGQAVVLGVFVKDLKLKPDGYVETSKMGGLHAVCLRSTDHDYLAENSWGKEWGLDGLFKMTESDFDRMVREAYILYK